MTTLSPNNVLLSKISAQVVKVSWLCPGRGEGGPADEMMTEYQGMTAQLGVMYTVCTHQGRSHSRLSTNTAASWQAWINRAGMQDTSPSGKRTTKREVGAQGSSSGICGGIICESLPGQHRCAHMLQHRQQAGSYDGFGLRAVIHRLYRLPGHFPRPDQSVCCLAESGWFKKSW